MRKAFLFFIIMGVTTPACFTQTSSFSSSALAKVALNVRSEFKDVRHLQTFALSDEINGEVDLIVDGYSRDEHWKLEIWRIVGGKAELKWSTKKALMSPEFDQISDPDIYRVQGGYDIEISGCAQHLCVDGVSGFLIYSGSSGRTRKAKLSTRDLDKAPTDSPKYDVTYLPTSITQEEKSELQDVICASNSVSNKSELPFECK